MALLIPTQALASAGGDEVMVPPPPTPHRLRGFVHNETGSPVAGAFVIVRVDSPLSELYDEKFVVVTDSSGYYYIYIDESEYGLTDGQRIFVNVTDDESYDGTYFYLDLDPDLPWTWNNFTLDSRLADLPDLARPPRNLTASDANLVTSLELGWESPHFNSTAWNYSVFRGGLRDVRGQWKFYGPKYPQAGRAPLLDGVIPDTTYSYLVASTYNNKVRRYSVVAEGMAHDFIPPDAMMTVSRSSAALAGARDPSYSLLGNLLYSYDGPSGGYGIARSSPAGVLTKHYDADAGRRQPSEAWNGSMLFSSDEDGGYYMDVWQSYPGSSWSRKLTTGLVNHTRPVQYNETSIVMAGEPGPTFVRNARFDASISTWTASGVAQHLEEWSPLYGGSAHMMAKWSSGFASGETSLKTPLWTPLFAGEKVNVSVYHTALLASGTPWYIKVNGAIKYTFNQVNKTAAGHYNYTWTVDQNYPIGAWFELYGRQTITKTGQVDFYFKEVEVERPSSHTVTLLDLGDLSTRDLLVTGDAIIGLTVLGNGSIAAALSDGASADVVLLDPASNATYAVDVSGLALPAQAEGVAFSSVVSEWVAVDKSGKAWLSAGWGSSRQFLPEPGLVATGCAMNACGAGAVTWTNASGGGVVTRVSIAQRVAPLDPSTVSVSSTGWRRETYGAWLVNGTSVPFVWDMATGLRTTLPFSVPSVGYAMRPGDSELLLLEVGTAPSRDIWLCDLANGTASPLIATAADESCPRAPWGAGKVYYRSGGDVRALDLGTMADTLVRAGVSGLFDVDPQGERMAFLSGTPGDLQAYELGIGTGIASPMAIPPGDFDGVAYADYGAEAIAWGGDGIAVAEGADYAWLTAVPSHGSMGVVPEVGLFIGSPGAASVLQYMGSTVPLSPVRLDSARSSDNYQISSLEWTAGWSVETNASFDFRPSGSGLHPIALSVEDWGANSVEAPGSVWASDVTAPATSLTPLGPFSDAGAFLWINSSTYIGIAISDADSGGYQLHWGYNGTPVYDYTGPRQYGAGFHNISHYGVDYAGNVEATSWTLLRTDDSPPDVDACFAGNLSSPGPVDFITSETFIEVVPADVDSGVSAVRFKVDGGAWTDYDSGFSIAAEGAHTIDMLAIDAVGNRRYVHRDLFVDDTPPTLALTVTGLNHSASPTYVTSLTTLGLQPMDSASGVEASYYRVDDGPWALWTTGFILSGEGHHNVTAVSFDAVGNRVETVVHLYLDDTAPSADAGYDVACGEGSPVAFNASRSFDLGCGIEAYRWDFGDGATQYLATPFASHSYPSSGAYVVVVTVWDNLGHRSSDAMTVYVHNAPPSASASSSTTSLLEGQAVTFSGNATSDSAGDVSGLSFVWYLGDGSVKTGRWISHTYADEGAFLVTLVVTDSDGAQGHADLSVSVANRAPVYAGPLSMNCTEGEAASFLLQAFDWGADRLTFTDDSPAFDADPVTGLVSFVPDEPHIGVWSFHLTIDDGDGGVTVVAINVSVADVNDAPSFSAFPVGPAIEDAPWTCQLAASDVEGDAIVFALLSGPAGMSCAPGGALSWTPVNGDVGTASVLVQATDARGGADIAWFTVSVANSNDAPSFTQASYSGIAVQDERFTMLVPALDDDADMLAYYALGLPAGCVLDAQTGLVSWVPDWSWSGRFANFTVFAFDPFGAACQSDVSVFVENVNDAPEYLGLAEFTFMEDGQYSYAFDFSDLDGDVVEAHLVVGPAFISVVNGSLLAAPGSDDVGHGMAKVLYTDGNASATFTIVYSVIHVNHSPAASGVSSTAAVEHRPYSAYLAGSDPDGDGLEWGLAEAPEGMSVDPATGRVQWTPGEGSGGAHPVRAVVRDASGASSWLNFTVTVAPVDDAPSFLGPFDVYVVESQDCLARFNATDPEGLPLSFASTSPYLDMASDGWAVIRYDGESDGFDALVSASDGNSVAWGVVRVHIAPLNDPPEHLESPSGLIAVEGSTLTYAFAAIDPDSASLTYRMTDGPANATVTETGVLRWTPGWADALAGDASFTVEATDGSSVVQASFSVDVVNSWTAPVVSHPESLHADAGVPMSFAIVAISRDPGSLLSFTLDSSPAGAYIVGDVVHWTPAKADAGRTHRFDFSAISGLAKTLGATEVTVRNVNSAPALGQVPALTYLHEGEAASIAVAWSDEDYSLGLQEAPHFSLDLAPAGMSIGPRTGIVTWTPARADVGETLAIVNVTDGFAYDVAMLSITVLRSGNAAPVLPQTFTVELVEGESAKVHIAVSDADGDGVALSTDSDAATVLSGTTDLLIVAGKPGMSEIVLTADDGEGGVSNMTVLLRVTERPDDGWRLLDILLLSGLVVILIAVAVAIVLFVTARGPKREGPSPPPDDGDRGVSGGGSR